MHKSGGQVLPEEEFPNSFKPTQPEFGQRLRKYRLAGGLSQRELAGEVVTPSYVSLLESGARQPTLEVVLHLARALRLSPDTLLAEEKPGPRGGGDATIRVLNLILTRSAAEDGDLDDAARRLRILFEQAISENAFDRAVEVGFDLCEVLFAAQDVDGRFQLTGDLLDLASRISVPEITIKVLIDRASVAREKGHLSEARERVDQAAELIGQSALAGTSEHVRLLGVQLAVLCEMGDWEEVPQLIDELLHRAENLTSRGVRGRARWAAATALTRIGKHQEAAAELECARTELASTHLTIGEWLRFCRSAASILVDAGQDLDLAKRYVESAKAALKAAGVSGEHNAVASVEARLAMAVGDLPAAERLSREVLDSQLPLTVFEQIRVETTLARALQGLGHRQEAADRFRSAALAAESSGALRQALSLWRERDDCGALTAAPSVPASTEAGQAEVSDDLALR
jgi:transcriptional regulator with XRE-family HTH domain